MLRLKRLIKKEDLFELLQLPVSKVELLVTDNNLENKYICKVQISLFPLSHNGELKNIIRQMILLSEDSAINSEQKNLLISVYRSVQRDGFIKESHFQKLFLSGIKADQIKVPKHYLKMISSTKDNVKFFNKESLYDIEVIRNNKNHPVSYKVKE